jgi:hypothetical protein
VTNCSVTRIHIPFLEFGRRAGKKPKLPTSRADCGRVSRPQTFMNGGLFLAGQNRAGPPANRFPGLHYPYRCVMGHPKSQKRQFLGVFYASVFMVGLFRKVFLWRKFPMPFTHESAARHGAKGGRKRSPTKQAHARANGAKGGRPRKPRPRSAPEGFPPSRKRRVREHCLKCGGLRTYSTDACLVCGTPWPL